jgi:hypothetical protein
MILPDFVLPSRVNQLWYHSGMDSEDLCRTPGHWRSYPHQVEYRYNNRGYRDESWPDNLRALQDAVWCVGDSFTVGIGSPRAHTWSHVLQQRTGIRTINVSMDGASNNWIARKAVRVLKQVMPKTMVLHWSFLNRREQDIESALDQKWKNFYNDIRDTSWPACERTQYNQLPDHIRTEIENIHGGWNNSYVPDDYRIMQQVKCTDQDDVDNTLACIQMVNALGGQCRIIHSFVPEFEPEHLKGTVALQCKGAVVPEFKVLDLARDGYHYDVLTSQAFVDQLVPLLK